MMPEGQEVQSMFAGIASRYDRANRVLSGGLDILWRKRLVKMVAAEQPKTVVDLATGSGDVAFALQRGLGSSVTVTGMDFCQPMLDEADKKKVEDPRTETIRFEWADCLDLTLEDNTIDAITISFGLRNLEDRDKGLREMLRALKPGGSLFVLEFTQPDRWFKPFYYAYVKGILPWMAKLLTGDKGAYDYLGGSIAAFPNKAAMSEELRAAGFSSVKATGLSASIVAVHQGKKQ
jgi:demethylmenaquinone methyltransferase/2-methoxy-6-polyprenyl-1,4-benzoquinol methylase|tara:strand:- start:76634 stop:77335 length:702 start_codon:yes stop_codon:yes gene_type:complete